MKVFLKLFLESIVFAFQALWSNRLRSILSLLGITIGIFAVIAVFTFTDSFEYRIRNSIEKLGKDVVFIQKWPWSFEDNYPWWKYLSRPVPSYHEYEYIKKYSKLTENACFIAVASGQTLKFEDKSLQNSQINGVSFEHDKLRDFEIEYGRNLSFQEMENGERSCLIGSDIAENLLGIANPVGLYIKMLGAKVKIVGVFKKEGNSPINDSVDDDIVVPVNFLRNKLNINSERGGNPYIMVKPKVGVKIEDLKEELRGVLRASRKIQPLKEDTFALNQISLIANQIQSLFGVVTMVGWLIGGFSILVGGFGIANIMFVSVRERTSLIGIQKALGAKNYFILLQFLIESVVLSLFGGLFGLILVYLGTVIGNNLFNLEIFLSFSNIVLGLSVSATIGILAGLIPAISASRMNPVDAIRHS